MPKLGMGPIRRAQLIQATFECIHEFGFQGTTISKVSKKAGVSTGIVSHYFGGKDGLLEATMRHLLKTLNKAASGNSRGLVDPKEKIVAIIKANFASEQVTPEAATVWLAFWGHALHVPALARLQRVNLSRLQSNLRFWLGHLMNRNDAKFVAEGLAAMIDGIWLRGAFQDGGINQKQATNLCLDYLERQLEKYQK